LQEVELHELINLHDGSLVTAAIAVVGSREDSHDVPFVGPVVPVHHKLVSPGYSDETIGMVELLRDVLAERVTCSSGGDTPAASIVGVRPEKVTDGSFMGHFLDSVQLLDLLEGVNAGGEATMEAENGVIDDSSQGEVVEQLGEVDPYVGVTVLPQALVVEPVHLRDLSDLVVTSQDG